MNEERLAKLQHLRNEIRLVWGTSEDAPMVADAVDEIERLMEEVGNLILAGRMEAAKNEDLRAENERLRCDGALSIAVTEIIRLHEVLMNIRDSECGFDAGKGDWCGGSIEEGRMHDKDCPARWAYDALNPEPTP